MLRIDEFPKMVCPFLAVLEISIRLPVAAVAEDNEVIRVIPNKVVVRWVIWSIQVGGVNTIFAVPAAR